MLLSATELRLQQMARSFEKLSKLRNCVVAISEHMFIQELLQVVECQLKKFIGTR